MASEPDPVLLVNAYLDGELDLPNTLALEELIARDRRLARQRDNIEALQRVLRERLPLPQPPPGLRDRLIKAAGVKTAPRQPRRLPAWAELAASVLLAAAVGSAITFFSMAPRAPENTAQAVVADHIRALMAPQPIDIASADRHTVKPWFAGRIPQAPRVVDVDKLEFPLIGGRIDVIGHTPVPTLVYQRRKHLISVTEIPSPGRSDSAPLARSDNGYNLVTFTADGVTYWVVSDLAAPELLHFTELFRAAPAS